jgi:type II secretory pathway component PulF
MSNLKNTLAAMRSMIEEAKAIAQAMENYQRIIEQEIQKLEKLKK